MNCESFRNSVFDFLEGTLLEKAEFGLHRSRCPDCDGLLLGIRQNESLLAASRVPAAPADLWPRIAQAIGQNRAAPFRGFRLAVMWSAAATLLLAILLTSSPKPVSPAPKLNIVVQEVGPELQRTFRSLTPRYEDVDAATAMVDTMFRSDY